MLQQFRAHQQKAHRGIVRLHQRRIRGGPPLGPTLDLDARVAALEHSLKSLVESRTWRVLCGLGALLPGPAALLSKLTRRR